MTSYPEWGYLSRRTSGRLTGCRGFLAADAAAQPSIDSHAVGSGRVLEHLRPGLEALGLEDEAGSSPTRGFAGPRCS